MKLYISAPMAGKAGTEVFSYFNDVAWALEKQYRILSPITGKTWLKSHADVLQPNGYDYPLSKNHAIIERDRWMVHQSDVVLVDLTAASRVSIGCMMELAWAHDHGKHTLLVMEQEGNCHQHAFVMEAADVRFTSLQDAIFYLQDLAK